MTMIEINGKKYYRVVIGYRDDSQKEEILIYTEYPQTASDIMNKTDEHKANKMAEEKLIKLITNKVYNFLNNNGNKRTTGGVDISWKCSDDCR